MQLPKVAALADEERVLQASVEMSSPLAPTQARAGPCLDKDLFARGLREWAANAGFSQLLQSMFAFAAEGAGTHAAGAQPGDSRGEGSTSRRRLHRRLCLIMGVRCLLRLVLTWLAWRLAAERCSLSPSGHAERITQLIT